MGANQVPNTVQVTRCRIQRSEKEMCSHSPVSGSVGWQQLNQMDVTL
jgi:hypothetical protein